MIDQDLLKRNEKFRYMMLDRMRQDCNYYLDHPNENNLWADNVEDQIETMKQLYNSLPEKPEWITMEEIDDLEKRMMKTKMGEDFDNSKKVLVDTDYGVSATLLTDKSNQKNKFIIIDQDNNVISSGNNEEDTIDNYIHYMINHENETDAIFDIMSNEENVKNERVKKAFEQFLKNNDGVDESFNLLKKLKRINNIQEKLNKINTDIVEFGNLYSPDTFEEFKDIIKSNKVPFYNDQICFYLLYDREFPYGYEFTIELKDDDFYRVIGWIINKDSIDDVKYEDEDKYRDVDIFKGSQSVIDFIQDIIDTDGLDYYEFSKGQDIIHNFLIRQKSNKTNESINLINELKSINNKINEVVHANNELSIGSFVYYNKDPFLTGYGIITQILDDGTCTVDFKYTKFGANIGIEESGISLKDLKDGNQMIDKQITKLQSQIDKQETIRKNCLDLSNNI